MSIISGFTLCMGALMSDTVIHDRLTGAPYSGKLWKLACGHPREMAMGRMLMALMLIILGVLFIS